MIRHSVNRGWVNWLTHWHGWATDSHLHHGLGATQALSLYRWYSKHMTRSQAEQLLKQEVSMWPQANSILLAQQTRILNCRLAAVRHLQAKQCQRCHFMGSQLYFSLSKAMRLQLKHGTWQWNQGFYNIFSRVWAGGMQVWAPLPPDGQLLFHRFRGKKEASLLETPAKLENIQCLCLPNLQGKCYCFKALGTKDRGAQPTVP